VKLEWPDCVNARDLGGLPTADGGAIRPGALLRSDDHNRLTPGAVEQIKASGVRGILDLRRPSELAVSPSPFAGDPIYRHVSVLAEVLGYDPPADSYGPLLDFNTGRIAAAFAALAQAPAGGVVVHCRSGRDRTGVLVALALSVAGVAPGVIAADYALTPGAEAGAMRNTLRHADTKYGGVAAYLRSAGVRDEQISAVRRRLR
jgi:protein-tyrosine phosphatase